MKKEKRINYNVLTIFEMLFCLLEIPCGLAFMESVETNLDEHFLLVPAAFLCLAFANFFRAAAKRYKDFIPARRTIDYILAAVYIGCAVFVYCSKKTLEDWKLVDAVCLFSFIPGRVLALRRKRKWYWTAANVFMILMIFYAFLSLMYSPEVDYNGVGTQLLFTIMIVFFFSIMAFLRVMGFIFRSLRLDLLKDIAKRTYAAEIIFGLLLLMLSFSALLIFIDPAFEDYGSALWYCFAIVTTIGFGDISATTVIGRVLSVILGIYGIIVVALITSIIVNFYGEMKKADPLEEPALQAGEATSEAEQKETEEEEKEE